MKIKGNKQLLKYNDKHFYDQEHNQHHDGHLSRKAKLQKNSNFKASV